MEQRKTVIFSDMTQVSPRNATSQKVSCSTWQAVPYVNDEFCGTMLYAHGTMSLPELRLDPGLSGFYRIYIGMLHTVDIEGAVNLTGYRLTRDLYAHEYSHGFYGDFARAPYIMEAEWKTADMSGQSVYITHPEGPRPCHSTVAYLKFVPIDAKEPRERRLIAYHDMHAAYCYRNPQSHEIVAELAPFAESDVSHLFIEYYMDVTDPAFNNNFFWSMDGYGCHAGTNDENFYRSRDAFVARGEDPQAAAAAFAHQNGIKIGFAFRMNNFAAQPPWDIGFNAPLYQQHPEWRCIDIDGAEIARLSYAHAEFSDMVIDLFCRMIRSGADGVHMLFNRGVPNLLYEKPLVNAFYNETGLDAFALDEQDERFIDFRCKYFTKHFIVPLRKAIERQAAKAGRTDKPFISVTALADKRSNRFFAIDLDDWAEKGLIDIAVGYPSIMNTPSDYCYNKQQTVDAPYYASLGQKYGIITAVDLLPRGVSPSGIRTRALEAYDSGVSHVAVWDTYSYPSRRTYWPIVKRLGQREWLLSSDPDAPEIYRYVRVTEMNGLKLDKYNPWWGL